VPGPVPDLVPDLVAGPVVTRKLSTPNIPKGILNCGSLIVCVSKDAVGDKTFTAESHANEGEPLTPFALINDMYCAYSTQSNYKGPDIDITYFLDGVMIYKGNYQQNYCWLSAGAIATEDLNAETIEGSWAGNNPGKVWISRFYYV
jgi:hypothetical protein